MFGPMICNDWLVLWTLLAIYVPDGTANGIPATELNIRFAVVPVTLDVTVTVPKPEFRPDIVCPEANPFEIGDAATAGIKLLV